MISVETVRKAYDGTVVVDDVSLDLPRGGVTALVGPNGAGKSTLLSCIARLLVPDAGRVSIDGMDVMTTSSEEISKRLAILRQENHLAVRLTVREVVEFGRFPHRRGRLLGSSRPTPEDVAKVDEALEMLELAPLAGRYLDEISGGQRQRVFVAMVLAQDTDYLLLDEPLNNLDMRHSAAMMTLLRQAADDLGKTVVVVIHDINAAAAVADEVVALRDGEVVVHGTPDEVMDPQVLASVFDLPVAVHRVAGQLVALPFVRREGRVAPSGS